jgi:CRISPR system Cascade subunit CasE
MIYLSRLTLNPRSRAVRDDLADCHEMHCAVMAGFPDAGGSGREEFGVLYRVDLERGAVTLMVQPDWSPLPKGYVTSQACKQVGEQYSCVAEGQRLRFRLRANPTKRLGKNAQANAGKRVELRTEQEQLAWLARKGRDAGFELLTVRASPGIGAPAAIDAPDARVTPAAKVLGGRSKGTESHRLTLASVLFDGELRVTDRGRFQAVLRCGIGSGKAYGFGLLSIAPA